MQTIDGDLVYSATDLVGFLACEHLTNLDRAATAGLVLRPMRVDAELDRIAKRGVQHEERFLAGITGGNVAVTRIEPDASIPDPGGRLKEAVERTVEAMRRGDEVIYQAALFDGRLRGHPDFLIKVDRRSNLGNWSYEVWDTKLARSAKGSAVLQICAYSDLLTQIQGSQPQLMHPGACRQQGGNSLSAGRGLLSLLPTGTGGIRGHPCGERRRLSTRNKA